MSIGSFSTSLSGLNANQQDLAVIGDNLANINTIAYKTSTVSFADLVSQTVGSTGANPAQVGLGVTIGSISPDFTQGGIDNTGISTNAAIQGNGFFVVGSGTNQSYTRAGNFTLNSDGQLVTADGIPVQGYTQIDPTTGAVVTSGSLSDIVIPPGLLRAPTPTTSFSTTTNLDAGSAVGDTFSSQMQIFDTLGNAHNVSINYTNTAPGQWTYAITVPGDDVTGGTPGTPTTLKTGTLAFNGSGLLTSVDGGTPGTVSITSPTWADGATATNFSWNLQSPSSGPTLTGFASPSTTSSSSQNGLPTGTVNTIQIDSTGEIVASFGVGRTVTVGQLAIANFNNPQGLVKLGTNEFGESAASGVSNIGVAGTGGRGTVVGAAVEQSNVDIATEFTEMILAQRGYQANSKSITVADQLLADTINLKQ